MKVIRIETQLVEVTTTEYNQIVDLKNRVNKYKVKADDEEDEERSNGTYSTSKPGKMWTKWFNTREQYLTLLNSILRRGEFKPEYFD